MNLLVTSWRCFMMLLCFSIKGCPLLPVDSVDIIPLGHLTVEPATLFPIGSNLTVYCHTFECFEGSKMYLMLNGARVNLANRLNCTTTAFHLPQVKTPQSAVVCKMKSNQLSALQLVYGLSLKAGCPPDKPANISCETTRSSDLIKCSLDRGRETHLETFYNVSVHREKESIFNVFKGGEEITIPRAILVENTKYTLTASAYNHLGTSRSAPFIFSVEDLVIPETPHIVRMEFVNDYTSALLLHWKTSESLMCLRPEIRLRASDTWVQREGAVLSEGLIRVDNLKPLTEYEFQIKTCTSLSVQTETSTRRFRTSQRSRCSEWSPSARKRTRGKGPSQQLNVWRTLGEQTKTGLRNVTVFWKPLPAEEYSGELLQYIILLDNGHEVICAAGSSQCSVQAPVEVRTLNVSAVTTYGTSPPAFIDIRHTGVPGPYLVMLVPIEDGDSVRVSWSSIVQKDLLYYVIEWETMLTGGRQWKIVDKSLKDTTVTGLMAGVRYNVSLFAVTTSGVSAPASRLIYSREQKPLSAPMLRVLIRDARRILVQWDELPLDQQRGFITKYTFYLQTLDSISKELNETVSGSDQRQIWLNCPEGGLSLQLTASNSAGEGPRGRQILSQLADPAVGLVIVIVFVITIFIAIVANLMCWSCVRKRIKQKCVAWGPEWLVANLPKPGHSHAIKLLEDPPCEPLSSCTYSDPPLSPILVIPQEERDEVYPNIPIEESQIESEQDMMETILSTSNNTTIVVEHTCYKPQITALIHLDEEIKDAKQKDIPDSTEEDRKLVGFDGLPESFMSNMAVDCSDLSHQVILGSIKDLLWPKTAEMSVLKGVCLQQMSGKEEDAKNSVSFLDSQQDQKKTRDSDGSCSSSFSGCSILNGGYLPQVSSFSTVTLDTLR